MRLHRVEPSPPARHDKKSRQLGNRYVVGSQLVGASLSTSPILVGEWCASRGWHTHSLARKRLSMPTPGSTRFPTPAPQATPCQASNSLTFSKCLEWGNAKPRQGKACQGQAMPRPRHAKATPCQGTTCQGQGMTCQRKARPRHANASQGNACQGHAQRKARQSKGNASQGNACQGHAQRKASQGMPNARQAKANASQGNACQGHAQRKARQAKGNASQGNACQGQAKAMPCQASNSLTFSK
ncbi:unnamed protein product [Prunus brigantina]